MRNKLINSWGTKPLSKIATFSNGLWKGKKGPFTTAKVLRNTNFRQHGVLSLNDVAEIEVETKQLEKRRLQKGDIILERSGGGPKQPVGRVVMFDIDNGVFSFSNFTSVIRIADRSEVEPAYLHQVLNWWHASGVTESIQSRSTGIRNLDFKTYKALEVPLPPLEEQRRIVAVLDEAFEGLARARTNIETNLQNAQKFFLSALRDVFSNKSRKWEVDQRPDAVAQVTRAASATKSRESTQTGGRGATLRHIAGDFSLSVLMSDSVARKGWKWSRLTDLARLESGHTPSRKHPEYWGGDVPWIGIKDARGHHGRKVYTTLENTNVLGIKNSSARVLPTNTVCLSRTASVGYVTIMGRDMASDQSGLC